MKTIKVSNFSEIPTNFTGIAKFSDGSKRWFKEGIYHRKDGPAIEWADGLKAWFKKGILHREDGPAVEFSNGDKKWYKEGNLHREDGPAGEYVNGIKNWYLEGEYYNNKIPSNSIILDTYKDQRYQKIIFYKVLTLEKVVTIPIWEELKINE